MTADVGQVQRVQPDAAEGSDHCVAAQGYKDALVAPQLPAQELVLAVSCSKRKKALSKSRKDRRSCKKFI